MNPTRTQSLRRESAGTPLNRITARRPADVAREVEALFRAGEREFVIARVDHGTRVHGAMVDQERLGAARYAAGLHSRVELEADAPTALAMAR